MDNQTPSQINVHRLTCADSKRQTDRWQMFAKFVEDLEHMYPSIRQWLEGKVAPQLDTARRSAVLLTTGDQPIASVVLKRGSSSKLCHVRIAPEFQEQNLGSFLFCLLAHEIRSVAAEVHFTLPESLWCEKREFFRSFGFSECHKANQQYRLFDQELSCSAPFEHFWQHAADQMPAVTRFLSSRGFVDVPRLILSIRPKFARAVIAGQKRVEIRRSFSPRWVDQRLCLYSSSPDRRLIGEATVMSVVAASPEEIWSSYGDQICCERSEFETYSTGKSELVAITLGQVREYERPLRLDEIRALNGGNFSPPQSYRTISEKDNFHSVLSVVHELHTGPLAAPQMR
jgi:predicted transcriptional regulator/N-acetylglutamate synthase-like GNAT family acetyltransferase